MLASGGVGAAGFWKGGTGDWNLEGLGKGEVGLAMVGG